jgi:hypothetical protein
MIHVKIENLDDLGKLGQGFTSTDPLEEVDIGDGTVPRPTFVNKNLHPALKFELIKLLKEYVDCFAWNYNGMPGLSRDLVEHKPGFKLYKQHRRNFNPDIYDRVKEKINWLLDAKFIRYCRYANWISNIVPCIDFRDLNKATPKYEYPMPIADFLVNAASRHRILSFLDDNVGYNQIFMAKKDISKTAFVCLGFVGLFEWVVITFGLKNIGATYQRVMNLIFHDLLGIILEVYIDDIVVKSTALNSHLANLRLAFEKMCRYGLKVDPLKYAFGVLAGKFLGFIVHEKGV